MKKVQSGEGATDFGQSTGLTQDELLGRAEPKKPSPDQEPLDMDHSAAAALNGQINNELIGVPQTVWVDGGTTAIGREELKNSNFPMTPQAAGISVDELERKIKDVIYANWQHAGAGGFPHWIENTAQVIMGLIP